jgi:hypothetical protein
VAEVAMRIADRYELALDMRTEYEKAGRVERGKLLDAFCRATGYNRKYAGWIMSGRQQRRGERIRTQRQRKYGQSFRDALRILWEASGYVCAERLRPWLPELVRLLEHHQQLEVDDQTRELIHAASLSTVERVLHDLRRKEVGRRMSQTKPGTLLRRQIPVIVGKWKEQDEPGYIEIDLVSHSGEHPVGKFLNTLSAVDICTGWSERVPILGKTQEAVEEALGRLEFLFPLEIKGLHPDNGSEFINYLIVDWCRNHEVLLSRGRPYRKNDNPHVEQKNWTLVRRLIGYERWDTPEQQEWLENFYTKLLRPFANCFQPTMKLIGKTQVNNHTRRKYDDAKTPLQRVIDAKCADPYKLARLTAMYNQTSPLTLKRQIDRALADMPLEELASA